MTRTSRAAAGLALGALLLGLAGSVHAVPLPFQATLTVNLGIQGAAVTATGTGVGDSNGAGGTAAIPAGVFALQGAPAFAPPVLSVIYGVAVAGAHQKAPFGAAANQALVFDGTVGTMGIGASAYLLNKSAKSIGAIPLTKVGVSTGSFSISLVGIASTRVTHQRFQLGMFTLMGGFPSMAPVTVVGTGFDARTAAGRGTLQLVSPARFVIEPIGALPFLTTLTITFTPEPATGLLVGAGIVALATIRRVTAYSSSRPTP